MFGDFSEYKLEKGIKEACEKAGVDYKGFHAFRTATNEYYKKEKIPDMVKGLDKQSKKEEIAKEVLKMADIEIIDKNGKRAEKRHI